MPLSITATDYSPYWGTGFKIRQGLENIEVFSMYFWDKSNNIFLEYF